MSKMTKLQKSKAIYDELIYTFEKFGVDITTDGIAAAVKGTIHSSLEKIEQIESETTSQ